MLSEESIVFNLQKIWKDNNNSLNKYMEVAATNKRISSHLQNCSKACWGKRDGKKTTGMRGTRMDCLATNTMEFPLPQIFKKEPDKHLSGSM